MAVAGPTSIWNAEVIAALVTAVAALITFVAGKYLVWKSTNNAVMAEVHRLLIVIDKHTVFIDTLSSGLQGHPLILFGYSVYKKKLKDVGILKTSLVLPVIQFYGYVDFLNQLQAAQPKYQGNEAAFKAIYRKSLDTLLNDYSTAFTKEFHRMGIQFNRESHPLPPK